MTRRRPSSAPADTQPTFQTSSFMAVGACCRCSHLPICGLSVCQLRKDGGDTQDRRTRGSSHAGEMDQMGNFPFARAFLVTLRGIWSKPLALTIKMPPVMQPSHSNNRGCITSTQRTHYFINSHTAWHVSKSSRLHRPPAILIT